MLIGILRAIVECGMVGAALCGSVYVGIWF